MSCIVKQHDGIKQETKFPEAPIAIICDKENETDNCVWNLGVVYGGVAAKGACSDNRRQSMVVTVMGSWPSWEGEVVAALVTFPQDAFWPTAALGRNTILEKDAAMDANTRNSGNTTFSQREGQIRYPINCPSQSLY